MCDLGGFLDQCGVLWGVVSNFVLEIPCLVFFFFRGLRELQLSLRIRFPP